jgi:phage-related protein
MADTIGTYYFQLAPSAEGISKSISEAMGDAGGTASKSFGASFSKALGTGGAIVGGIATAVGGITTAFASGVADVASYGDEIDKMSQKMGISATAYQEWDAVMQHSGTSMESLKASMKTMANAAQSGNEAFQALGISEEQVATMSQEDLFSAVITGLQGMEEGTERTYLASQLLGRGATELGALLNTSAEDTQAMKDRVHELGGVLSDEAIKAGAAFQDQLQDMQTASQGLVKQMMSEFLPGVTEVMGGLTDIFAGDTDKGAEGIANGISTTLEKVTAKLPEIMKVGSTIVLSLADSIIKNLPSVIRTGMEVIQTLILGISEMLPQIVTMAASVIVEIVNGLSEAAPVLIPAVLDAVMQAIFALIDNLPTILEAVLGLVESISSAVTTKGLPMLLEKLPDIIVGIVNFIISAIPQILTSVIQITLEIVKAFPSMLAQIVAALPKIIVGVIDALISNLPMFIDAGIQLFVGLIGALPEIIVALVDAVPDIIDGICDAFTDPKTLSAMADSGKALMDGLINGIKSMISAVGDTVKNVATNIVDGFKDFMGIHSPSTVFEGFGENIDKGLANGINGGQSAVTSAMNDLNNSVLGDISANANVAYDGGYSTRSVASTNDNSVYGLLAQYLPYLAQGSNVTVTLEPNADGLFTIVKRANNDYKKQTGRSAFA